MKIISIVIILLFVFPGLTQSQILTYSNYDIEYDTLKLPGKEHKNDTTALNKKYKHSHKVIRGKDTIFVATNKLLQFFPSADTQSLKFLYGNNGLSSLQNLNLSISSNRFSVYTELLSDYLKLPGVNRFVKIGFGGLLSSVDSTEKNDSTADALQRFFGAGGNAMLYCTLPVLNFDQGINKNYFRACFLGKIAADLPAVNSKVDKTTWNTDLGIELSGKFSTISDKFNFLLLSRAAFVYGTEDFINNLGLQAGSKRTFGYISYYVGFDIKSTFRIGIFGIIAAPDVIKKNRKPQLSVQLLPFG